MALTIMNLVTPKAAAKHELLFQQTHLSSWQSMEQHISKIGIGYRGRHWKYIAIYNATVLSLQQSWSFDGQKMYFWTLQNG